MNDSIQYWRTKAECYGNMVHGCQLALERAGYPANASCDGGAVKGITDAVNAIAAELATLRSQQWKELTKDEYHALPKHEEILLVNSVVRRVLQKYQTAWDDRESGTVKFYRLPDNPTLHAAATC